MGRIGREEMMLSEKEEELIRERARVLHRGEP
jgi:hypothetical protein